MNRLKLIAILGLLLGSGTAYAQLTGFNGFCEKGATPATVSGLNSTNTLQGVVPGGNAGCLVQVYLTGTTTPAVIKANAGGGTLSNPFRANQNGQWLFFANTGQGYDVVMSGGLAPNAYTTPVTLTDLLVPSGSGGSGTVTNFTAGNLAPLFTTTVNNGSTTPNLAFNLSTAPNLDFFGNVSGSTGAPSYIHFVAGANMTITPSGGNTLTFSSTGGGTGLTGLTGDCLAGDQSTACTVVMVHAFDNTGATPNSRFYIETEVPPAPGATSGSVGLYAENIFNGGGPFGKYALYYDNDDLSEWVSQYIDNSAHTNSYLYGNNSALNIVNDGSPLAGTSQFFFANDYDAIKQRLGIYIDNQNPNSLIQIRSEGTDPTPFLVFGKGTEIIQLEGQEVFTSPISFDPTPVISALKTNIDGGVVSGSIRSQATKGFQWYTNSQASSFSNIATLEYNPIGVSNAWRWGFDADVQFWTGSTFTASFGHISGIQFPTIATGGISCLQEDATGHVTGTGSSCGGGGGSGTVTNFIASSGSWPTWLVPSVATSTTIPTLSVSASAIPYTALTSLSANTVLGALTATTPSGLAVPSCSGVTNALTWTSGTGFGCNSISAGAATFPSITSGTNTSAAMVVGTGASLTFSGGGTINASTLNGVSQLAVTKASVSHQFFTSYTSTTGLFTSAQPAFTDISGQTTLAQFPNASANSVLVGSGVSGAGTHYTEITLGSGLSMAGTVLSATGGGSLAFSSITSATNTTAAMLVGTGASLAPTGSGAITATALVALTGLPSQAASTVIGNANSISGSPTALSIPSCSGASNALTFTFSVGFGCNGAIQAVNIAGTITAGSNITITGSGTTGSPYNIAASGSLGVAWSNITAPSANLALTMAANTSTFTYNAATGSSDMWKITDTASNTGTGILLHITTASSSTEIPWQADANGCGWQVTATGLLKGVGTCSNQHGVVLPASSGGLPAPIASTAQIFTDSSGNLSASEAGVSAGAFSRICTVANTLCGGGGGTATLVASAEVVSFSATPTFSTSFNVSRIVLTGNVTTFTLGAGADGQLKTLCFKQGSGPWTVTNPAGVHGFFAIGNTNGLWNCQAFAYDNTDSIWQATSLGVTNQ